MTSITIRRPDDWHLHLRDGAMMEAVLPASSAHFARALIMPNLIPPVATVADALAYRDRILAALPSGDRFEPLMTLYLTESSAVAEVDAAVDCGQVKAFKLYPAGATTNSQSGVRNLAKVMPVLERMAQRRLPLCIHGEVTDPQVDVFDREAVFIDSVLAPLRARLPELRIVMEHVTTAEGVAFAEAQDDNVAATLTVHHLMINRNAMLVGGIRPHYYCLPVAKRERHRLALVAAATSGQRRFFMGTDSAPHSDATKECACGCAGIFTAPCAIACLAQVFDEADALGRLEAFVAENGAAFYGLAPSDERITLHRRAEPATWPMSMTTSAGDQVTVFDPLRPVYWSVEGSRPAA